MRVFCPFTQVEPETAAALKRYDVVFADCSRDEWAYADYFQDRWAEGSRFVNVEHDVVPHAGAIEEIWACPHDWCWFSYPNYADDPTFGLTKFSAGMIAQLPDLWERYPERARAQNLMVAWSGMDLYFAAYAQRAGFVAHQHFPPVGHK